jgi:hypothetical protein
MQITLANDKGQTTVDKRDLLAISKFSWSLNSSGYAYAYAGVGRKNTRRIALHTLIWETHNGPTQQGSPLTI